jgi:hypothetical protein
MVKKNENAVLLKTGNRKIKQVMSGGLVSLAAGRIFEGVEG